ncbi:hypothetical protein ACX0G7_10075 [Flavitalea antarctica]
MVDSYVNNILPGYTWYKIIENQNNILIPVVLYLVVVGPVP